MSTMDRAISAAAGFAAGSLVVGLAWHLSRENSSSAPNRRLETQKAARDDDLAELRDEQLSRNRLYFGEKGQAAVDGAFVVVVGLGGVGSHAAHMLVRAGVSRIRLVDFDQVTLSSLNRHAVAVRADVGRSKAEVLKEFLLRVAPWCTVEACVAMYTADAEEELLSGRPDYVLDCIDDVGTKADLLAACQRRGLRVLASMGAGGKGDPTQLLMGTLPDASMDKLAVKVKKEVAARGGDPAAVPVVYSSEPATRKLAPLTAEQAASPGEFGAVPNFRLRVIPVLGTSPAIFGQGMAAKVLTDLAGCPMSTRALPNLSAKRRSRLHADLRNRERKLHGATLTLDTDDVAFVARTVWRLRSALSPADRPEACALVLARWDVRRAADVSNLVLVTLAEAEALQPRPDGRDPRDELDMDTRARVHARLEAVAACPWYDDP